MSALSWFAFSTRKGATSARKASGGDVRPAEVEHAVTPTTLPPASRTGAAREIRPSSSSSDVSAYPCSRTTRRAVWNAPSSVIVVGVRASNVEFAMTLSTISVGAQASRLDPWRWHMQALGCRR